MGRLALCGGCHVDNGDGLGERKGGAGQITAQEDRRMYGRECGRQSCGVFVSTEKQIPIKRCEIRHRR